MRALATRRMFAAIVASAGIGACGGGITGDLSDVHDKKECEVTLALPNMVCAEGCPIKVQAELSRVTGVRSAAVDFEGKNAVVAAEYPACSRDGVAAMIERLYDKGYVARLVQMRAINRMP